MEQYSQYLMRMKSKQILNPHFRSGMNPFNNSCEEQAFADDAAGPLGGFIWPPRSYSCTFCKREFRSAQALGGHMNVHRRDRARLKQSLTPQGEVLHHPCKLSDASNPSQVWFLDSNPIFVASPHSSSRVSAISTQENLSEPTHFSPFCSSIVQEHLKPAFGKKVRKEEFSSSIVETNLSMGLNLVVSQNRPSGLDCDEVTTCKRHKATVSPMPFFVKHKTGSLEDLDLELRLGDPPKVKQSGRS